jgi:hypothetical protein
MMTLINVCFEICICVVIVHGTKKVYKYEVFVHRLKDIDDHRHNH